MIDSVGNRIAWGDRVQIPVLGEMHVGTVTGTPNGSVRVLLDRAVTIEGIDIPIRVFWRAPSEVLMLSVSEPKVADSLPACPAARGGITYPQREDFATSPKRLTASERLRAKVLSWRRTLAAWIDPDSHDEDDDW